MRRCSGSPCSTYLVLRSHDVSHAASRPSPLANASIRLPCSSPCDVGMYGRRNRRQILNFLKMSFFKKMTITYALSCALPAF
ncbi:unnamed protein product [Staurois parvus]|uniref:Uncharacterized protein n=1 Tax=Staurois parvus TaxID=386267 RepID=A0ABN9HNZ1_9NEOB|nr:unnamed protein product [Staurois parvus]